MPKYVVTVVVTTDKPISKKNLRFHLEKNVFADPQSIYGPNALKNFEAAGTIEKVKVRSVDED